MTDKKSCENRRKLLKSIAAGSGAIVAGKSLPESWSRPVIDSIVLPAHAQTSGGPFAGAASQPVGTLDSDSIFGQVTDKLIPKAHAVGLTNPYVCVTPTGPDKANVKLYLDNVVLLDFGEVPVNGSSCAYTYTNLCSTDISDLLESLGLIKDAQADSCECCFLESISGVGAGYFDFCGTIINFSVGPGVCSPTIIC